MGFLYPKYQTLDKGLVPNYIVLIHHNNNSNAHVVLKLKAYVSQNATVWSVYAHYYNY